jgi:membrane protein implicated in regulation of membrane protease activity
MSFLRVIIFLALVLFLIAAFREFSRKKPVIEKEEELEKAVLEGEILEVEEDIALQEVKNKKKKEKLVHICDEPHKSDNGDKNA